jgi:hypothetical protein
MSPASLSTVRSQTNGIMHFNVARTEARFQYLYEDSGIRLEEKASPAQKRKQVGDSRTSLLLPARVRALVAPVQAGCGRGRPDHSNSSHPRAAREPQWPLRPRHGQRCWRDDAGAGGVRARRPLHSLPYPPCQHLRATSCAVHREARAAASLFAMAEPGLERWVFDQRDPMHECCPLQLTRQAGPRYLSCSEKWRGTRKTMGLIIGTSFKM